MYSEELLESLDLTIDREMAEIFASEIDAIVLASPDDTSSRNTPEAASKWCEVEIVEGSEISWLNEAFQAPYTRIFLRHDTIQDSGYGGVLYRLLIETGLVTVGKYLTASRRAVMMNILDDPEEAPLLFQAYLKDPALQLAVDQDQPLPDLDSIDLDQLANGVAFGQLIERNFVDLKRITQFELEGLYNQMAFIASARRNSKPESQE